MIKQEIVLILNVDKTKDDTLVLRPVNQFFLQNTGPAKWITKWRDHGTLKVLSANQGNALEWLRQ